MIRIPTVSEDAPASGAYELQENVRSAISPSGKREAAEIDGKVIVCKALLPTSSDSLFTTDLAFERQSFSKGVICAVFGVITQRR